MAFNVTTTKRTSKTMLNLSIISKYTYNLQNHLRPFHHQQSDFSFIPIRENMFSIIEIYNLEYHFQSLIQILFQNPSNQPLTLVKGLVGCAQQDV